MPQPKELTVQLIDQGVALKDKNFKLPRNNCDNLTIGAFKATISKHYTLKKETNIRIQGADENVSDRELISKYISGNEICFTVSGDTKVNEELESKGLRRERVDDLAIERNKALDEAQQHNTIEYPEKSKRGLTARITENEAGKNANQRNGIIFGRS